MILLFFLKEGVNNMAKTNGTYLSRKKNLGILLIAFIILTAAVLLLASCDEVDGQPAGTSQSKDTEPQHTHEYAGADCTSPSTCSCGETEGEPLGHDPKAATCTEDSVCLRCGETVGEALGHDAAEATCTDASVCSRCGETVGEALGHDAAEATCTDASVCSRCNITLAEALGHSTTAATCTAPSACTRCMKTFGEALGHSLSEATCSTPATCSRCSKTVGEALGHDLKGATCSAASYCARCEKRIGKPLGHIWSEATCTTPMECTRCKVQIDDPLGHTYKGDTCSRCGATDPDYPTGINSLRPDYNLGDCRDLSGDISVVLFYMNGSQGSWSSEGMVSFTANEVMPGLRFLEDEARKYGVELRLTVKQSYSLPYKGTVDYDVSVNTDILQQAAQGLGYPTDDKMIESLKSTYGTEVICITIFNDHGTGYAINPPRGSGVDIVEHIVLFALDKVTNGASPMGSQASLVANNILYLYGAEKLSSTVTREILSYIYCPNDIMLFPAYYIIDNNVDFITAFYVGWTDDVPEIIYDSNW